MAIKSKIAATLHTKEGQEIKVTVQFVEMDMSDELATKILEGIKTNLPEVKKWSHGKVTTGEVEEFEIHAPDDQETVPGVT